MMQDAGLAVRAVIENYVKATRAGDTLLMHRACRHRWTRSVAAI